MYWAKSLLHFKGILKRKFKLAASIATKLTVTTKANSNPKDLISFSQIGSCKVLIVQNLDYAKSY